MIDQFNYNKMEHVWGKQNHHDQNSKDDSKEENNIWISYRRKQVYLFNIEKIITNKKAKNPVENGQRLLSQFTAKEIHKSN